MSQNLKMKNKQLGIHYCDTYRWFSFVSLGPAFLLFILINTFLNQPPHELPIIMKIVLVIAIPAWVLMFMTNSKPYCENHHWPIYFKNNLKINTPS